MAAGRVVRALAPTAAAIALLFAGVAHGAAPPAPCAPGPIGTFFATTRLGLIDLSFVGARGARVTFFECVGDRAVELGRRTAPPDEVTRMLPATTWRCGRLVRRFAATAKLADGSFVHGAHAIRTRSCVQRFELEVPPRLAPGALARVRIVDRWRVGDVRASFCHAGPGRRKACRPVVFPRGKPVAVRSFRVAASGRWRVELRVRGHSTRATIAVGVRATAAKPAPPTLLATGDSTMDPLDSFLSDQLGDEASVVGEVAPALSISKSDAFQPIAEGQVARLMPQTTVVSIGANEGWDMHAADGATHACCDAAWIDEYVRRARRTMLTYGRRVFWLTVVAQKGPHRAPIVAAVNAAILRAAEGLPEVHVVRTDLLFSPHGYREVIRYRGHDVHVREPDGIHLNIAGAEIAAREVVKAIHATRPSTPCTAGSPAVTLVAGATRLGVIDLHLFGALGAPVTFFECAGDRTVELGTRTSAPGVLTTLYSATSWRCGRLTRRFAAAVTLPDGSQATGTHTIRTRSCAQRFGLDVPRRLAPGALARIRLSDRWHVGGVRTSLCVARPGRRLACRQVVFAPGKAHATRTYRVAARGRWRIELRVPGHTSRATIAVGVRAAVPKAPPPTLLATGDSTMDVLDGFLSDQLGDDARVVSAVEPGLPISRADAFQPMAVKLVARLKPKTTVVSIGANEGWPMRAADGASHECCDAPWVDEFARRVRRTMVTFGRRVFWLTIVAPRDEKRVPIFAAVNAAIVRAAQGLPDVHLVRLDLLFSPDGYRDVIRYDGRDVRVRAADGIHLNVAGAEIAAREVVKALRAVSGG